MGSKEDEMIHRVLHNGSALCAVTDVSSCLLAYVMNSVGFIGECSGPSHAGCVYIAYGISVYLDLAVSCHRTSH